MPKKPAPTAWTPKLTIADTGEGHHEISIGHAINPWLIEPWTDDELATNIQTTKWIATIAALTLGPLINDIETEQTQHQCTERTRREDGSVDIYHPCHIQILDPKTIMEDGGGGSYISVPSEKHKDWAKRVELTLNDIIAWMMGPDA